ncbi:hypothetical protein [Piscirickettsia salmonis]|nr:hypothetical protein [Piscirickettsia salmonis]QHS32769.1 hypothetical protein GW535_09945 [Piscirickettsia salmonis]QIX56191.1 hypothetical protein GW536_12955 [Piscirickettsia salmonis]
MPLSTLNEVQNQYALYFKQACLNTSQSFITRGSIKNGGASVGIENIEGHFTDQEIESKFKVLKESLRGCSPSERSDLLNNFSLFINNKTNHDVDTVRVLAFFKDKDITDLTFLEILYLEAINFEASAALQIAFYKTNQTKTDTEEGVLATQAQKSLFTSVADLFLSQLNLSYHPNIFANLDKIGLGNQPEYIQGALKCSQQLNDEDYQLLKEMSEDLKEMYQAIKNHVALSSEPSSNNNSDSFLSSLFSCFATQKLDLEARFKQYQSRTIETFFDFFTPDNKNQSQEALKAQLSQLKADFLSSSDSSFQSSLSSPLNRAETQNNQPSPSSPLLFSQQQAAAAHSTAPTPEPSPY